MKRTFKLVCAGVILLCLGITVSAKGAGAGAEEKVVVNYANFRVREELEKQGQGYYYDLIDAYLAEHPNVELKVDSTSHDPYLTVKFKSMVAADALPELFEINSMDMLTTYKAGRLMDWTDTLNADSEWKNSFLPVWNEVSFDGGVYAIPYQFITNEVVYYNSELVKKAGYDAFPGVWEDMLTLCGKLKGMGYMPIALGIMGGWPLWSHLGEPLCEYLCGPEWVYEIGHHTGKRGYDEPDFINVLKTINDLMKQGYFNEDLVAIQHGQEDNAYLFNEEAAITLIGSWGVNQMVTQAPEDLLPKIKVAPIPRPRASKPGVEAGLFTGGSGWEYGANTKMTEAQKEVVVDLVKILTGTEYARYVVEARGIPVIKMEYVTGWDPEKVPKLQVELNNLISAAPKIPLMNQQQSGPAMSEVIYKMTQEMLVGSITPEKAAANIQEVYEKVVADMKSQ